MAAVRIIDLESVEVDEEFECFFCVTCGVTPRRTTTTRLNSVCVLQGCTTGIAMRASEGGALFCLFCILIDMRVRTESTLSARQSVAAACH